MIIDELLAVLPAPEVPLESNKANDWGRVTDLFGDPLPMDYMQFIDVYGSGSLCGYLTAFNPFSTNQYLNLTHQVFVQLAALRAIRVEFPDEVPFPLFFEPGGLLPWGISIDGDLYCWLTEGISSKWNVVVVCRSGGCERFEMTMTQFLARIIKGEISSVSIPNDLSSQVGVRFEPYQI